MTALKILGILAVLFAGGIGAFSTVRYERRRLRVLDRWIDMIRYIRVQIDCYLTPLHEILAKFSPGTSDIDLSSLLDSSRIYLDTDSIRLLESFIREIGGSYREEQLRNCDYCLGELRHKREKVSAELPMRQRLTVTLCACLSIGTAILLW